MRSRPEPTPAPGAVPASGITRRRVLRDLAGAGLALGGLDALLQAAAEAAPARGRLGNLGDIDHVVILIQENRSFDHYFGTYSGVHGFGDPQGVRAFRQRDLAGQLIQPFRVREECMSDITHDWGPQHESWNHGRMDRFVLAHQASSDGAVGGLDTMAYYDGAEVAFYHALANAFTLCDGYHCSVLGPTDPNRLMSISATIDPAGKAGGPLVQTNVTGRSNVFGWTTMPESLERKGISWKVYTDPGGGQFDSVFTYFKQYQAGTLHAKGIAPTYPGDFLHDLAHGTLPQVSWLTPNFLASEHPQYSTPVAGQDVVRQVVEALVGHPKIWQRTALFLTWDENGGFFDHVAPPVAPAGTPGEYLTVGTLPQAAQGIRGPIGLGFRVPMLVISPFSRGGLVCPDRFDHTSMLRFLETRFRARVPNLSRWRRRVTGDLTSAFDFGSRPAYGAPRLPRPQGSPNCTAGTLPVTRQPFPHQQKGRRRRPSGVVR